MSILNFPADLIQIQSPWEKFAGSTLVSVHTKIEQKAKVV